MSGGSLDYVCFKVEEAAATIASQCDTPVHQAFAAHLLLVAKALKDVEWMLSCDTQEGSEIEAIRRVVSPDMETEAATRAAEKALADLRDVLASPSGKGGECFCRSIGLYSLRDDP